MPTIDLPVSPGHPFYTRLAVRSYIAEAERGRRHWAKRPEAQRAVYHNRRRGYMSSARSPILYDTGGMRRTHLRGHHNIPKRLLIHASAFNLGILMRAAFGRGTPRGLQGRQCDRHAIQIALRMFVERVWLPVRRVWWLSSLLTTVLRTHSLVALA